MKKTLLLFVALFTATIAFAYDVEIDGIYYNLNHKTKTAEVTCQYEYSTGGNNYSGITSITIPSKITYNTTEYNITSIKDGAFYYCKSLTSITIPYGITDIKYKTFSYCFSLTSITIPNSVTHIRDEAFSFCTSLKSITIPNSITHIGKYAFIYCPVLKSITIPNKVTSIGEGAFADCESLTSIEVDANNQNFASIDGALYNKDITTLICCPSGKTSITIPNSVTSIGEDAFRSCSSLKTITIGNSVTLIGDRAFDDCSSLTLIDVDKNNQNYASIDGVLYNKDITTLICCPSGKTSITIPNSVTSIGKSTFMNCKSLTSITIPNSVTFIGDGAFLHCSSLKSITIGNSVTFIGDWAFYNCSSLKSITCLSSKPPKASGLGADTKNCILRVPHKTYNNYIQHEYWGQFLNIEAIDPTNLETSKISSANIYTTNGTLHVEGATDDYHILDAAGRLIYSGNATTLQLPRGIYLVTMGGEVEKIVL